MNNATTQAVARIQSMAGVLTISQVMQKAEGRAIGEPFNSELALAQIASKQGDILGSFGQQQLDETDWALVLKTGTEYRNQVLGK